MKAKNLILVVLLTIVFTACAQPAGSFDQEEVNSTTPSSTNDAKVKQPTAPPTPAWSDAPLSSSILISHFSYITNESEIHAIDPLSGLPLANVDPIPMGGTFFNVRSPDGSTLATVAYPHDSAGNNPIGRLHFVDLATWQDSKLEFDIQGWVGILAYSRDGRTLVIVTWDRGSNIYLVDMITQELIGQKRLKDKFAKAQFSRDGSGLMLYMNRWDTTKDPDIPPSIALLGVPGLEIQWEQALEGVKHGFFVSDPKKNPHEPGAGVNFEPGIAFSPVEDKIFVLHADSAHLTSIDFDRRRIATKEIVPKMSWLERLLRLDARPVYAKVLDGSFKSAVISQDGKTIYVTGVARKTIEPNKNQLETQTTPFGLQVIDAQSGTELAHYDIDAERLSLSPDGRLVFLYGSRETNNYGIPVTHVFDLQSEDIKTTLDGQLYPAYSLDGKNMVYVSEITQADTKQRLSIFDAQTLQKITDLAPFKAAYLSWLVGPLY